MEIDGCVDSAPDWQRRSSHWWSRHPLLVTLLVIIIAIVALIGSVVAKDIADERALNDAQAKLQRELAPLVARHASRDDVAAVLRSAGGSGLPPCGVSRFTGPCPLGKDGPVNESDVLLLEKYGQLIGWCNLEVIATFDAANSLVDAEVTQHCTSF